MPSSMHAIVSEIVKSAFVAGRRTSSGRKRSIAEALACAADMACIPEGCEDDQDPAQVFAHLHTVSACTGSPMMHNTLKPVIGWKRLQV